MPPIVNDPAPGTQKTGGIGSNNTTFKWLNAHNAHLPVNAAFWRVKVGSTQGGWDYYPGTNIIRETGNPADRKDGGVHGLPGNTTLCWATIEYQKPGASTWYAGSTTNFYSV